MHYILIILYTAKCVLNILSSHHRRDHQQYFPFASVSCLFVKEIKTYIFPFNIDVTKFD